MSPASDLERPPAEVDYFWHPFALVLVEEGARTLLAFVIVASLNGEPVDPGVVARVDTPDLPELTFVPDEHLSWTNLGRSVHFSGWQAFGELLSTGSRWHVAPKGLTAFTGHVWPRLTGWDWTASSWASQLAGFLDGRDLPTVFEDLFGCYSLVDLPLDGRGHVVPDHLSTGMLYTARTGNTLIIASQANLAARAATPEGQQPARDLLGTGWTAFYGYPLSTETGFADVRLLPFGGYVELDPVTGASIAQRPVDHWVFRDERADLRTLPELTDLVEEDLRTTLRILSTLPAPTRELRLSGGKDSRLLTALAVDEGIQDCFHFFTFGVPGAADTVVAEQIVRRYGLNWSFEDRSLPESDNVPPFEETIRTHVFQVSGALNGWDAQGTLDVDGTLRISGNLAELLRFGYQSRASFYARTVDEAWRHLNAASDYDRLSLLRPEAERYYLQSVRDWMSDLVEQGVDVPRLSSLRYPHQIARRWIGAGTEANPRLWAQPFSSPVTMRVAHALPIPERDTERFHLEIMRRCDVDLTKMPFANQTWRPEAIEGHPEEADYRRMTPVEDLSELPSDWRLAHYPRDRALFDRYLLDRSNPLFGVLDPDQVARALQRGPVNRGQLRFLYGALTSAIWLAGEELPRRINRTGEDAVETPAAPMHVPVSRPDRAVASPRRRVASDYRGLPRGDRRRQRRVVKRVAQSTETRQQSQGGRLLLVVNSFPNSSETFIVDRFLHLLARGWDVQIVALRQMEHAWRLYPEVAREPLLRERVHFTSEIDQAIRALEPDLVHFEFGALAPRNLQACREVGSRSIVSFRGYDICYHGLENPGYYDDVWRLADQIHTVSSDLWQRAIQRGCPPSKPHAVIFDAADPAYFEPGDRVHSAIAGTASRPLCILAVGRLVWKKGHEYGLQAVKLLVDRGVNVELRIIGEGNLRQALNYSIFDLGLGSTVTLLGAQSKPAVRREMRQADLLMHPSISEGFAVSVIEAQAMKLPVVCSDAEGLPENVADGVSGYVVPKRDPAALAERIERLARDPHLRTRMGEAGRERVLEHFTLDKQIDRFEELYRHLMDLPARSRDLWRQLSADQPPEEPDLATLLRLERAFSERALDDRFNHH